jgi:hypothetical protein
VALGRRAAFGKFSVLLFLMRILSPLRAFLLAAIWLAAFGQVVAQTDSQSAASSPTATGEATTFSTDNGPQFIVVRDFKVTEIQPTGNDDEYTLTLLALTTAGEPDQRVVGGILFEVDGKSTLIPFEQGGVGDFTVKAQPNAGEVTLRAVDSNVTHKIELPRSSRLPWFLSGGGAILILIIALSRRRARQAKSV